MIPMPATELPPQIRSATRGKYAPVFEALEAQPGVWHLLVPAPGDHERVEFRSRQLLGAAYHYHLLIDTTVRGTDLYASYAVDADV